MAASAGRSVFMGPRIRRLRRDLGLTQADMAADLEISAPYVALLERNQRPMTADMLLRLARTYTIDLADLAGDGGADNTARMQSILKEPMFSDIDIPALEISDLAVSYPGMAEAFLRLYTAYREEQLALADRRAPALAGGALQAGSEGYDANDPVAEVRRFLAARRNNFAGLDDAAERLVQATSGPSGFVERLKTRHKLQVRYLPPDVMLGSVRRLDLHRKQLLLEDSLDTASLNFQLAQQLVYLEMENEIGTALEDGQFTTKSAELLARRALAGYAAAALIMPYAAFRACSRDAALRSRSAGAPIRCQLRTDRASHHDLAAAGRRESPVLPDPRRPRWQHLKAARRRRLSICQARRRVPAVVSA
jgi:transcriptional regulator with XRE-family HTH domain